MDDVDIFEELIRVRKTAEPTAFAIVVEASGSSPRKAGAKMLVSGDGSVKGSVGGGRIEAETIEGALQSIKDGKTRMLPFSLTEDNGFVCGGKVVIYIEPVTAMPKLVIIGVGHVGQALAKTAKLANFDIVLADPYAKSTEAKVRRCSKADLDVRLSELDRQLTITKDTFLVIATRTHDDDFLAVERALQTPACYIGVLGSRRKKAAMKSYLAGKGIANEDIRRVITPVGLDIAAQTPEEIAISIVAQIVQLRRTGDIACVSDSAGGGTLPKDGEL